MAVTNSNALVGALLTYGNKYAVTEIATKRDIFGEASYCIRFQCGAIESVKVPSEIQLLQPHVMARSIADVLAKAMYVEWVDDTDCGWPTA